MVKIKPLLDEYFAWLETVQVSGKGKLTDAVRYALNERKYLYTFLENGDVPIDNSRAENAIRPFAVGRKNWLFSNTANGAKASAALYSIISTAQANGIDAEKYLTEVYPSRGAFLWGAGDYTVTFYCQKKPAADECQQRVLLFRSIVIRAEIF